MILTPANETRESVNSLVSYLLYEERKKESQTTKVKEVVFKIKSALNQNYFQNIYHNKNLTEAEKTRAYRFKVGDVLLFSKDRDFLKVAKNDYCQITKIDNATNLITIKTGAKTTQTFNPINIKGKSEKIHFEVFEERERIFRVNDKVAFTRSIPGLKIINADGGKITGISSSTISLKLNNGKNIRLKKSSVNAKHLDHSYAVTAHKAQGLTCENVIAVCESYRKKLTSQKNFYVEISRAKERAIIVADSRAAVIAQLEQNTGIKISARQHQNILPLNVDIKDFVIVPNDNLDDLTHDNGSTSNLIKQPHQR
jgi:preprotein translocase subunit YajC